METHSASQGVEARPLALDEVDRVEVRRDAPVICALVTRKQALSGAIVPGAYPGNSCTGESH
jgi:hypothetical protein